MYGLLAVIVVRGLLSIVAQDALLNLLGIVVAFAQPAPIWYELLGIVAGLPALGILVLLYRKDANAFFRRTGGLPG